MSWLLAYLGVGSVVCMIMAYRLDRDPDLQKMFGQLEWTIGNRKGALFLILSFSLFGWPVFVLIGWISLVVAVAKLWRKQ